jgi:hypothetical protein
MRNQLTPEIKSMLRIAMLIMFAFTIVFMTGIMIIWM